MSLVITWRDRKELMQALPSFVELIEALQGEIIIVNFGGSPGFLREQLNGCSNERIKVVDVKDQHYFNKSCAQNIGAYHSSYPVLFFCDCDIILDQKLVGELVENIMQQENLFATIAHVKETVPCASNNNHILLMGYTLTLKKKDGRTLQLVYRGEDAETGLRMAPGLLLTRRAHFLTVQGYNSQFSGWGWEAQDIISRLVLGAGLERRDKGIALHISHDEESRTKFSSVTDRWENRDRMFRQAIANYYAGNFYGTYFSDIAMPAALTTLHKTSA